MFVCFYSYLPRDLVNASNSLLLLKSIRGKKWVGLLEDEKLMDKGATTRHVSEDILDPSPPTCSCQLTSIY